MENSEYLLNRTVKLHVLVFRDFIEISPYNQYDFFSLVDLYMRTSDVRKGIDERKQKYLFLGDKNVLNSIRYHEADAKKADYDVNIARWMGAIYTYLQWIYEIPSKSISMEIPAKKLYNLWNPYHELSYKRACEKIYQSYFVKTDDEEDFYEGQ